MTLVGDTPFGAGGAEPYEHALRSGDTGPIWLRGGGADAELELTRWRAGADPVDLRLFAHVGGPVLDVGCGPGRMVRAARGLGLEAWGVDVSEAAVAHAAMHGAPAFVGSVFDRLPNERHWRTLLLLDGNIGIGGDVRGLLARCARVIDPDGAVIVELHDDDERDARFRGSLVDLAGRESAAFPWAEIGLAALVTEASGAGLDVVQDWEDGGRVFAVLRRADRASAT